MELPGNPVVVGEAAAVAVVAPRSAIHMVAAVAAAEPGAVAGRQVQAAHPEEARSQFTSGILILNWLTATSEPGLAARGVPGEPGRQAASGARVDAALPAAAVKETATGEAMNRTTDPMVVVEVTAVTEEMEAMEAEGPADRQ